MIMESYTYYLLKLKIFVVRIFFITYLKLIKNYILDYTKLKEVNSIPILTPVHNLSILKHNR